MEFAKVETVTERRARLHELLMQTSFIREEVQVTYEREDKNEKEN